MRRKKTKVLSLFDKHKIEFAYVHSSLRFAKNSAKYNTIIRLHVPKCQNTNTDKHSKYQDLGKHLIDRRFQNMGVRKRGTTRGHDPRAHSDLGDITERFISTRS